MDTVQTIANIKMPFPSLRVSRWIYFYEYENHTRTLKKQINKKQNQTDKYRKQPNGPEGVTTRVSKMGEGE